MEYVNIEKILNYKKVSETLPHTIKIRKPNVIYKYQAPIRNMIFNYNDTLDELDNFENVKCKCKHPNLVSFCNKKLEHIVTGDMDIIKNKKLKMLFSYGPMYRIPKKVKWIQIYKEIKTSIDECIIKWSRKEHVTKQTFSEWKNEMLKHVQNNINNQRNTHKINVNKDMIDVLDDEHVKTYLEEIHKDFVVVNADKCSNNIIIICKKYYMSCIIKELELEFYKNKNDDNNKMNVNNDAKQHKNNNKTYIKINKNEEQITKTHKRYMNKHHISIHDRMMVLPKLYMIPKMHKNPPKERYIAASNSCTTKPLSQIITKCLKLLTNQHRKYCDQIYVNTGVNRMWIIDNSKNVLEMIESYNENNKIKNVNTYDFSTLYTKIPHKDLKCQIKWVLDKGFHNKTCMYVNDYIASWKYRKNTHEIDKDKLYKYICYLIDNIYINVNNQVFRQVIGIPMGTDCAPFLANLYLYALEFKYLEKLTKDDIFLARKFSNSFRYIDDLLMFNNDDLMETHKHNIYPKELILNKENKNNKSCTFLDINVQINGLFIDTSIYDKRDDFNFRINNFPNLSGNIHEGRSYGIIISQMIRYSKVCKYVHDFYTRTKTMINKLCTQFFCSDILKKKCSLFFDKYYHLIRKYNCTKKHMIHHIFS